jgi:hypothetical protein
VKTDADAVVANLLLGFVAVASGLGPAVAVMLYRYRRVLTPVQREQTAWLIWSLVLAVGIVVLTELVIKLLPVSPHQNLLVASAADTARVGAVLLVPVAIALAIARYRLWAIDLIVHRTLVYGLLTAIIVGLYVIVVGTLSPCSRGIATSWSRSSQRVW